MNNNRRISYFLKSKFKKEFIIYCNKKKINEIIYFYEEMNVYKKCRSDVNKKRLSIHILSKYFNIDSIYQINISNDIYKKVIKDNNIDNKYEDAYQQIKILLLYNINEFIKEYEVELKKKLI